MSTAELWQTKTPDWRQLELADDVFREPSPDGKQLVLWLRGNVVDGFQKWERIGNVLGAEIASEQGLYRTQASVIRARQKVRGVLGRLLNIFRKAQGERVWLLPNGDSAEQIGDRETDRILVWAEPEAAWRDEERIRERWGPASQIRRLGKNLFLVHIRETPVEAAKDQDELPEFRPMDQAMQLLAAARKSGDCLKQAPPLIDLGIICVQNGKIPQAIALMERALAIARKFGERSLESDAHTNLATAFLAGGQLEKARELLEAELARARETGDRYQEKLVLVHLAAVHAKRLDHGSALAAYEAALVLARQLADTTHEAELLWFLAIQCAEMGLREQAIVFGQAAIELWRAMGHPGAQEYRQYLEKYRLDVSGHPLPLPETNGRKALLCALPSPSHGPGILRMAMSASKSMAQFLGSGLTTVPTAIYRQRLESCAECVNHTGARCKLCGCFTKVKAQLPHEKCPLGQWGEFLNG